MSFRALAFVIAGSLIWGGCSSGIGVTPARDASCCVEIASRTGSNLHVTQTSQFLMLSSADAASDAATGRLLDQVHRRFYESFAQAGFALNPLSDKLVLVCFDGYQAMEAYAREADDAEVSWMDAYYSYRTNRVAVTLSAARPAAPARARSSAGSGKVAAFSDPGAGGGGGGGPNLRTVTHELAHQLAFNSGLQVRGRTYPFWLTEGLATNFEADSAGACGLGREEPRYRSRLVEAKAGGRLLGLDQLAGMAELPAGGAQRTRELYAQAWGLFHYLLQVHRPQLVAYMADLSSGWPVHDAQSLRQRFVAAFGPIEPLEADFLRFVDGRRAAPSPAR